MRHLMKELTVLVCGASAIGFACAPTARGHETDQYTLPHGRVFADMGPYLNAWAYDRIEKGVAKVNERIAAAVRANRGQAAIAALQTDDEITRAVNGVFADAYSLIEGLDMSFATRAMRDAYPGQVPGFEEQFVNIYEKAHFVLDPRQFFRIWHATTFYAYGTYLGTDKVGHFTDMGRHYWNAYSAAKKRGASEEEAVAAAVRIGTHGAIFSERGMLGYLSAGAYSNADLVANYLGFLFYRNLTAPVMLNGRQVPPMLVRDGEYWKIAPHVRRDNDFFAAFICDHLNEVYNPSHFEKGMRDSVRKAINERTTIILERYADENGCRRPISWFDRRAREYRTYFGVDYGHRGPLDEMLTIANTCFEPLPVEASPNDRNDRGYAPLHDAVIRGEMERITALLSAGADASMPIRSNEMISSEWGATALHLAARDGRREIVRTLLQAGASVHLADNRGATALHYGCSHPGVMAELIEAGADPDAVDRLGRTALHWAANVGSAESIDALVKRGATVDASDLSGETPLHLAARRGAPRTAARLLANGAAASAAAHFNVTPLHLAAARGDKEAVEGLLQGGADSRACDEFGLTPLHEAARLGRAEAAAALLAHNADPNAGDCSGVTPLHLAARLAHETCVGHMLSGGADPNLRSRAGLTALHEAAFCGRPTIINALTAAGSDRSVRDAQGRTPRDLAGRNGHRSVMALLVADSSSNTVSAGAR